MTKDEFVSKYMSWFSYSEREKLKDEMRDDLQKVIEGNQQIIEDHTEKLKAFADFLGVRIWEESDKDLSGFVDEFLNRPQTIEDHEAVTVPGIEAYTEQQLKNYEAETAAIINEAGGCSQCGDLFGFNYICEEE